MATCLHVDNMRLCERVVSYKLFVLRADKTTFRQLVEGFVSIHLAPRHMVVPV